MSKTEGKRLKENELTLKSRISANMYGPFSQTSWDGLIISVRITDSAPYRLRKSFAHSIPSWPSPPITYRTYLLYSL